MAHVWALQISVFLITGVDNKEFWTDEEYISTFKVSLLI